MKNMITQKDIESLTGPSDKYFNTIKYMFLIGIVISIISAGYNLYLSINYVSPHELNFSNALALWNSEIPLNGTYTGFEHHSILKLNNSILNLGVALVISIQLFSMSTSRNRNKRILASLKECGALNSEKTNA